MPVPVLLGLLVPGPVLPDVPVVPVPVPLLLVVPVVPGVTPVVPVPVIPQSFPVVAVPEADAPGVPLGFAPLVLFGVVPTPAVPVVDGVQWLVGVDPGATPGVVPGFVCVEVVPVVPGVIPGFCVDGVVLVEFWFCMPVEGPLFTVPFAGLLCTVDVPVPAPVVPVDAVPPVCAAAQMPVASSRNPKQASFFIVCRLPWIFDK